MKTSHFAGKNPTSLSIPLVPPRQKKHGARIGPGARRGVAQRLRTHGAFTEDLAGKQSRLARWEKKDLMDLKIVGSRQNNDIIDKIDII